MGQTSFIIPDPISPDARRCLGRARIAGGYDRVPLPAQVKAESKTLTFERDVSESGYLMCPWPTFGYGTPVVLSATLRERAEPYHLLTELARGKLNHVRNQLAEWEAAGLETDPADRDELHQAVLALGKSALDPAAREAAESAEEALAAGHKLGDKFTRQFGEVLLQHRVGETGPPTTRVGARMYRAPTPGAEADAYTAAFNAVRLVPDWRAVEPTEARTNWTDFDAAVDWAEAAGLAVSIGPLVDLTAGPFPDWLDQWAGDLPSLAAFMCDFVETAMTRYRDRVADWLVFAGFNHADGLGLGEDDRLRLGARLLEAARLAAPGGTLTVGLSLAWGDYLADEDMTYSPLVFADTLLRGGLQVGGIELELLCGDGPRVSQPRTLLDVYTLLDLFALLGVPLEIALAAPTGKGAGAGCPPAWGTDVADLAVAIGQVAAVHWDSWAATDPARVPGCALWANGQPVGNQLAEFQRIRPTLLD